MWNIICLFKYPSLLVKNNEIVIQLEQIRRKKNALSDLHNQTFPTLTFPAIGGVLSIVNDGATMDLLSPTEFIADIVKKLGIPGNQIIYKMVLVVWHYNWEGSKVSKKQRIVSVGVVGHTTIW